MHDTEEVSPGRLVVEDRRIVHFVLQHSLSLVLLQVDLTKEVNLLPACLEHNLTVRTDVAGANICCGSAEIALFGLFITVVISPYSARHAEVVDEERVLVDVLEDLELALAIRELESVLEGLVRHQLLRNSVIFRFLSYVHVHFGCLLFNEVEVPSLALVSLRLPPLVLDIELLECLVNARPVESVEVVLSESLQVHLKLISCHVFEVGHERIVKLIGPCFPVDLEE